jgi:hypothetical protein
MKKVEHRKSERFGRVLAAVFEEKIEKRAPSNYFLRVFHFFGGFLAKTVLKFIF